MAQSQHVSTSKPGPVLRPESGARALGGLLVGRGFAEAALLVAPQAPKVVRPGDTEQSAGGLPGRGGSASRFPSPPTHALSPPRLARRHSLSQQMRGLVRARTAGPGRLR